MTNGRYVATDYAETDGDTMGGETQCQEALSRSHRGPVDRLP